MNQYHQDFNVKDRLELVVSDRKSLGELAEKYHYMHKAPSHRSFPFGWKVALDGETEDEKGEPYGFIIYTLIHYTRMKGEFGYPGLPTNWQVLQLSRLWLNDALPRNSETCIIAKSLKRVQKRWLDIHPPRFPELPYHIVKVISYCDLAYFSGTIYRAANFREVRRVKRPAVKEKGKGSRISISPASEMICFIYDLKHPQWEYTP